MTSEEMERAIQFILAQQSQLTATVGHLAEKVDRNADSVAALLAITELQSGEIKELGAAVRTIDERERQADVKVAALADAQRETDESVKALINTVERYIERRNGQG